VRRACALLCSTVALTVGFFTVACCAQTQAPNMKTLVGKQAVVQRMPFYQSGTYQLIPNTYAGQTATIVEVKPSAMFAAISLTPVQMASLPQQSKDSIENLRSACTVVIQFADGTKADTGAIPVMPSTLPSYLQVLDDHQLPAISVSAIGATPVSVTLASESSLAIQLSDILPEDQVQLAIKGNGKDHWTRILDGGMGANPFNPLVASITLYMPEALLALQSASAKAHSTSQHPKRSADR